MTSSDLPSLVIFERNTTQEATGNPATSFSLGSLKRNKLTL